jgi:phosphoenolpyruvate synthase/pyruvate phosphate dikinase
MGNFVKHFKELTPEYYTLAGGKGSMLARMFKSGYPVPEGFVVLPAAFQKENLRDEAWLEIQAYLKVIAGKATTMLKTGDRVMVDGGRGVVQILNDNLKK